MVRPALKPTVAGTTDAFFTSNAADVLPRALLSVGSVPDVFCKHPIVLCISTARLPTSCGPVTETVSDYRVIFTIAVAGREPFRPKTNLLRLDSGVLVGKAVMQPLRITDSQYVARTTTVFAAVFHGRRRIASARGLLSAILWADAPVCDAEGARRFWKLLRRRAVCKGERTSPRSRGGVAARLHAESCETFDEGNGINVSVTAARSLQIAMRGRPLAVEIALTEDVEGCLKWKTMHRSRVAYSVQNVSTIRLPAKLLVPGLGMERPLRFYLEAYECSSYSKELGYCETSVAELLAQRRFCPQLLGFRSHSSSTPIAVEVESVLEHADGSTELCLLFSLST